MEIDKYIEALEQLDTMILRSNVTWEYLLGVLKAIKEDINNQ